MARSWILKTEPGTYSWDDLVREQRTAWTGVTNAAALIHLRSMSVGDEILIYHTGGEKQIVGIAKIVRAAYPDPAQQNEKLVAIDVVAVRAVKQPVTLAAIKADDALQQLGLVRQSRLSCMPVAPAERARLKALGAS